MQIDLGSGPVLVFGGPYSNVRATLAMREKAADLGIAAAQTICTGDVVAYCAEPEETIAVIRDWGCHVVAGNCEEQLAAGAGDCGCGFEEGTACNRAAKDWYAYADARVSRENRAWMGALPRHIEFVYGGRRVRVVHGGVRQSNRFVFASDTRAIAEEIGWAGADIVIGGHCGLPFIAEAESGGPARVWFNAGVIGMPANDGTSDGWYGLMSCDEEGLTLATQRLTYDHAPAASATRAGGHADAYARALETGIWPSFDVLPEPERAATGVPLAEQRLRLPTVQRP